jgi:hypothetical protein
MHLLSPRRRRPTCVSPESRLCTDYGAGYRPRPACIGYESCGTVASRPEHRAESAVLTERWRTRMSNYWPASNLRSSSPRPIRASFAGKRGARDGKKPTGWGTLMAGRMPLVGTTRPISSLVLARPSGGMAWISSHGTGRGLRDRGRFDSLSLPAFLPGSHRMASCPTSRADKSQRVPRFDRLTDRLGFGGNP